MSAAEVTVIMAPRERYSRILQSIDSLYENTEVPFKLIVVDGALPPAVKKGVEEAAEKRGFEFIYHDYPLTPNEARNVALKKADTEWIVFVDNDVVYLPNWLPPLIEAANEFDAWLVGPTIVDADDDLESGIVHAAGGDSGFEMIDGKLHYHFVPGEMHVPWHEAKERLQRGPTTMVEFHAMLARRSIFDKLGPFDEKLLSFADHDDIVVQTIKAGGKVIFEPAGIVMYPDPGTDPSRIEESDLPYFLLRWGDAWNDSSIDHAAKKWGLDPKDNWMPHTKHWIRTRRRRCYPVGGLFGRIVTFVMFKISESMGRALERSFCEKYTRGLIALRKQHGMPT